MKIIKPYKKEWNSSYTSGAYATIELLKANPRALEAVYLHSGFYRRAELTGLCRENNVPVEVNDKIFQRINQKENSYVLGLFQKYPSDILWDAPHVALVNPSDMGNLGTIVRTLVGLGLRDLAIITPAADIWNPKTIRASMGALFHLRFRHFESLEAYRTLFPAHRLYLFMPDGEVSLDPRSVETRPLFSLVFGNEAAGLDDRYRPLGTTVKIPQAGPIDSFNLAAAVSIGAFLFTR